MARFKREYDRDRTEQGRRVALDIKFENDGYKEERMAEGAPPVRLCGRAGQADRAIRALSTTRTERVPA